MIKIGDSKIFCLNSATKIMINMYADDDYKSDSKLEVYFPDDTGWIGEYDLKFIKSLIKTGNRAFLSMVNVSVDITAPLYWYNELNKYNLKHKIRDVTHRFPKREFTLDDFSCKHLTTYSEKVLLKVIEVLNFYYNSYIDETTKDCDKKMFQWQIKQLLPNNYNQRATICLSYEELLRIYITKNHKLDEWKDFCEWVIALPYMKEFIYI